MSQWVKNPPAIQETQEVWVQSLGQEDPLEEGMATHSSISAWRIPWTEESGGYSPWDHKESDMTEVTKHTRIYYDWMTFENTMLSERCQSKRARII